MQPKRAVQFINENRWHLPDTRSQAPYVNRSNLFCLRLRGALQADRAGFQHYLKRQNMCHIRRHRYDRHYSAAQSGRSDICAVIANDHHWSSLVGLGALNRFEVCKANLAPSHEFGSASAAVGSHNSASPDSSHSCQASS